MAEEFDFVEFIPEEVRGVGVAAIMVRPGKGIYLTERVKDKQLGCPGGKVDSTDFSFEDAIIRELLEETGLVVDEERLYWFGYQKVTTEATDYTCWYIITLKEGEILEMKEPTKHGEWKTYSISEALKLPLFCGTKPTLKRLIEEMENS